MQADKQHLLEQLIRNRCASQLVLEAIASIERSEFVPEILHYRAWEDVALPIEYGQSISQPTIVAMMTEALAPQMGRDEARRDPRSGLKTLEIGTGTGYQAAILSCLYRRVWSVERHYGLYETAKWRLARVRPLGGIYLHWGDGAEGWKIHAPFDRILVTASVQALPPELLSQLAPEGLIVYPLAEQKKRHGLYRSVQTANGELRSKRLCDAHFVPLLSDRVRERVR